MSTHPAIGETIPDIPLEGVDGEELLPSRFRPRKLVLFFYPRDNTPGCTTEAKEFSELVEQFAQADTAVIGVSKDSPQKHRNFIARHGLEVTLATDREQGGLSDALGFWREKKMYGKSFMGMVRSTVLIDREGRIARLWEKVSPSGHAAQVLEAARALD